jgi:hypothetical protein
LTTSLPRNFHKFVLHCSGTKIHSFLRNSNWISFS